MAALAAATASCGPPEPVGVAAAQLYAEDFPSLASRRAGGTWVAYQAWVDGGDRLEIVPVDTVEPERVTLHASSTHLLGTALAADATDALHAVFSEQTADGWALREVVVAPGVVPDDLGPPGEVHDVVAQPGVRAVRPVLAADPDGSLLLAWIRNADGTLTVQVAAWTLARGWSAPVAVTAAGTAWSPSVTAIAPGRFALAYDAAHDGDYDVHLARISLGADGAPAVTARQRVTDTPRWEAHPSVAAAGERLYVAYDVGPVNWAKEGSVNKLDEALHADRIIEVVAIEGDRVAPLAGSILEGISPSLRHNVDQPRILVDAGGNLVMLFRGMPLQDKYDDPDSAEFKERMATLEGGAGFRVAVWFTFLSRYDGVAWEVEGLHRKTIEESAGRLDAPAALAALPKGGSAWAVVGDGREQIDNVKIDVLEKNEVASLRAALLWWWKPITEHATLVTSGRLRKGRAVGPLPVGDWRSLPPPLPPAPPAPPPVTRTLADGTTVRLALGDLHRHTDISRCSMNWDGSLTDAFRYAYDVGGLDFLAITDHFEHMTRYDWWRTWAYVDAFHAPGRMVNLRAYERASSETGHRNVIARGSDLPIVAYPNYTIPGRDDDVADAFEDLWQALEGHDVLTIPHTPAGMAPEADVLFEWDTFHPRHDRLVEVFQGYRGSSEAFGAPRMIPGVRPWYDVRPALDRGLHFGLIASSDHQSSDGAFAGTWTPALTRDAVYDALFSRLTFAATVRCSLWMEWAGVPMGTAAVAPAGPAELSLEFDGFGHPLVGADLIVDGERVETRELSGTTASLRFTVGVPASGNRYAYVRVRLEGDELAWSSPVRLAASEEALGGPDGPTGRQARETFGDLRTDWVGRHGEVDWRTAGMPSDDGDAAGEEPEGEDAGGEGAADAAPPDDD